MSKFARFLAGFAFITLSCFNVTEGTGEKWNGSYAIRKDEDTQEIYTASWAVQITEGGDKMADKIAMKYGFQNIGRVRY